MPSPTPIQFDNSYLRLGDDFYQRQQPASVPLPGLIRVNRPLANSLGIDADELASPASIAALAGNALFSGSDPIATVYAGHQFGGWNPQLGDGRALLLGEIINPQGQRYDMQLKGSGRTPYSRGGDGKSPLGPVLREFIVSEAMAALGIPTTRALAAVTTGEMVFREQGGLPGAILTRIASSHLRVGTVQFFSSRQNIPALGQLVDHVLHRHYPDQADRPLPALALLQAVIERQAALIAQWQGVGFIHGVMNTDNMLLCGETIDYGPCAFMDTYHPGTVFSSIDHQGRYAYGNQPAIANWNLAQLAQALLPIIDDDPAMAVEMAQEIINSFADRFFAAYRNVMANKLGIGNFSEQDETLYQAFLTLLEQEKADFTLAFRRLADLADDSSSASVEALFNFGPAFDDWLSQWRARLTRDPQSPAQRQTGMYRANPVFIPRNHRVEEALRNAQQDGDFSAFHRLVEILDNPFEYQAELARYATPAKPEEQVLQTFCGT